jgi:hypothetical protein
MRQVERGIEEFTTEGLEDTEGSYAHYGPRSPATGISYMVFVVLQDEFLLRQEPTKSFWLDTRGASTRIPCVSGALCVL